MNKTLKCFILTILLVGVLVACESANAPTAAPASTSAPIPSSETPALLKDYHTLRSFGSDGDTLKRFGTVKYSPYNSDGWDKLEFLTSEVRNSDLPTF